MSELLEILKEIKYLRGEIIKMKEETIKKEKEIINFLAFQGQVQKNMLIQLIKLNKEENGTDK
jgi:hypothetical protein